MTGNLDGVRVLDLTGEPGFFAGKLLGDLGADVVKIEPPPGDPARRRPPFWDGTPDPDRSLLWLALNTSKRGLTLDLEAAGGRELFLALAARADVVLETEPPGRMAARGLGWDALHAHNRRLVLASLTPFGQTGPYAEWRGSDLTVTAMSGNLWATGDPDRAPVRCALPAAYYHGGIELAVGVVLALLAREGSGEGQHVDVALQEVMLAPDIGTVAMYRMTGNRGARSGAFMLTRTMRELYQAACARNLMLAPINTPREITASEQLAAREFFIDVENPGRGRLRYPGAFATATGTTIGIRRPAPRLGEHTA